MISVELCAPDFPVEAHDRLGGSPSVSVVIPTYNRATLLSDSIASARGQTFRPLEVIVVDDGSTDDTSGLVESLANAAGDSIPVKYVRQHNQGGNVARNRGIQEASGQFDRLSRQR